MIKSISGGNVRPSLGGVNGSAKTTPQFVVENITAVNTDPALFFSNANCRISVFNVRIATVDIETKSEKTITRSEATNKWPSFRGYSPDSGYSLSSNLFMYKDGQNWASSENAVRNNFFGVQYPSIIKVVGNAQPDNTKTFLGLSYDANSLFITTEDGIKTSIGQLSELIDNDFLKDVLDDGVTTVEIYDSEGIYSAGFMKAKPDLINGSVLKGTNITIELISTETGILRLSNVHIHSENSPIGSRQ